MRILEAAIVIVLLSTAIPPVLAEKTVFLPAENNCTDTHLPNFDVFDLKLGDSVFQIENRKDCRFHKEVAGQFLHRQGALSQEGETCLSACAPPRSDFSGSTDPDQDCSQLEINGQKPDIVFCYLERESASGPPILNEICSIFSGADRRAPVLAMLQNKYGPAQRIVLPNRTVEYQWKSSNSILSFFVMMGSCSISLMTAAKRKKGEEVGPFLPGFSVESAAEIEKAGGSVMAESEKTIIPSK